MTGVRQPVTAGPGRKTYVYDSGVRSRTYHKLGDEPRLRNRRTPAGAGCQTSPRRVLNRIRQFLGQAHRGCPFRSGDSVQRADVAVRRAVTASKHHMKTDAHYETGQPQQLMITLAHRSLQVMVRSLGGSSEGEGGGTPLPLETPLDRVYHIEGNHGGPLHVVVEGGVLQ